MTLYVLANRRAGRQSEHAARASRAALDASFGLFRSAENARHYKPEAIELRHVAVFDADDEEVRRKAHRLPKDVILEPEILHKTTQIIPTYRNRARHLGIDVSAGIPKGARYRCRVRRFRRSL